MKSVAFVALVAAFASAAWVKPPTEPRFDGGQAASHGQFPYTVSLKNTHAPICGGVIVGPRHILTEAWCIDSVSDMSIIVGCEDYFSPDCIEYKFQTVHFHPNVSGIAEDDLAVVTVSEDIALGDTVAIIKLSEDVIEAGASGIIIGWFPNLRYVDVTVQKCYGDWDFATIICSGPSVLVQGNYGSPLVVDGVLAGIAAVGSTLDIHQRVAPYVPWIKSVIVG